MKISTKRQINVIHYIMILNSMGYHAVMCSKVELLLKVSGMLSSPSYKYRKKSDFAYAMFVRTQRRVFFVAVI